MKKPKSKMMPKPPMKKVGGAKPMPPQALRDAKAAGPTPEQQPMLQKKAFGKKKKQGTRNIGRR